MLISKAGGASQSYKLTPLIHSIQVLVSRLQILITRCLRTIENGAIIAFSFLLSGNLIFRATATSLS